MQTGSEVTSRPFVFIHRTSSSPTRMVDTGLAERIKMSGE